MNAIVEEIRAALWSVWNRRWLALAVAWGLCLVGWLAVAMVPNAYESKARIFVQLDDVLAQQIGIGTGSRKKDIERVTQTLTSAVNLEKVIRSTRLGETVTTPRQMESAVEKLAETITVKNTEENLFEITAESGRRDLSDGENAQLAQDVVQKLIDIFREQNLGGSRGEMRETIDFLDQQLADRQKQLEKAEQERLAFEASHPELIGGAAAISQRLESTRAEMRSVDADLAAAQSALAATDGQLAGTPRTIVVPGQVGGAAGALMQAEANLSDMRARGLTDSHPDVISIEKQIASLRQQAARQGNAGGMPNPAYSSLQSIRAERIANVQALQSRKAALNSEIMQITANQSLEPGVAAEAQRISRDYEVLREQYDKLLKDREELRLRGQVETERNAVKFEVIDPPTTPRTPSAPNRPLLLFGVLVMGIGAGAGAGWAMGQLRSSYATAGKLENTFDLPVIGTISHVTTEASRMLKARRFKLFAAGAGGLCGLFVVLLAVEFIQRGMVA
ncbi:chain-length determining protein [Erythrobacter sp. SG61-1L]|uniref:XrtA system polysaccharide chain length determinant n=1 Tax=Erythrobacter sp. SG61-1L TaxID=1603897 RepID=UPI0006C926A2|nr:XrtA system polysaccharide chain length determinant [Erythrobacter sp. SG61-1L]KPL67483.1 chain-length determining protein [Erythrobacter sp. SG61-1L]